MTAARDGADAVAGRLTVVGLGPGDPGHLTQHALTALTDATDLVGYAPYLARIPPNPRQARHASDNREELDRARHAIALAAAGRKVALVSGGDAGVFGMASAVFEAVAAGPPALRLMHIEIMPGISAMFAAAARIGAPLGHDFCAISLSDNLKSWEVVTRRLTAAASSGFTIALYNPRSHARPWQLGAAFDLLRAILPPLTPVAFATAVTRPDEQIHITTLLAADPALADMRTLVLIGSEGTHHLQVNGRAALYASRRGNQA